MSKLSALFDSLVWAVPFSLAGTVFGAAIRKDVLSKRQQAAAGVFAFVMGPLCGAAATKEFGVGEFTGYVIAAFAPTVIYDVVGFVIALLQAARDDSKGIVDLLLALFPWGRKK